MSGTVSGRPVLIGTRGSALALAQARLVAEAFGQNGEQTTLVVIETEGDRRAPDIAWGEGAFVAAIEQALLDGRADVAVHSAKDVPTREDPRLHISAYLPRADPRDVLVVPTGSAARSLDDLPTGASVGTDSPRRVGFLLARRPDLRPHPLHGNVDTRLRRLDAGETDALLLAAAGLDRLGRTDRITQRIDPDIVPPAPGQGAIAIQVRAGDERMRNLTALIDHADTRAAVTAERAFLAASGGGCRAPIGVLATVAEGRVAIVGGWTAPDGKDSAFGHVDGLVSDVVRLGSELAQRLGSRAAIARWQAVEPTHDVAMAPGPGGASGQAGAYNGRAHGRVLVTRQAGQADGLLQALHDAGIGTVHVPSISIEAVEPNRELDAATRALGSYAWVVLTSANGARAIMSSAERTSTALAGARWAAIGSATRHALEQAGVQVDFQPGRPSAAGLGDELPLRQKDRVLMVRGDLADDGLPDALRARGAHVDDVVAYRTLEAPPESRAPLQQALRADPIDAVLFTSGSTARGLVALAAEIGVEVTSIPAICIGPETASEARLAGFTILAESPMRDAAALSATTVAALDAQRQETP